MQLPTRPLPAERIRALLDDAARDDMDWRAGRGWSLVYDVPGEHGQLVAEAMARFANENALSHSAFPSAARFESAVISMVTSVIAPGTRAAGVFTTGGTESILLAVKAARDRPGRHGDDVLVPATAHPAFGKAAHFLGLRLHRVPVDAAGAVDPADLVARLGSRTLLVGLSAPNFPFGSIDPVDELAAAAAERDLPVHVDAALGGLFLPFLDAAGRRPPRFGLDVPGVTSVSVDLHKYGYSAKGGSVLLFADPALRHASYYLDPDWPGGAYAASSVLGTRPIGPAAAAFASLLALGTEGYRQHVAAVMATTDRLMASLTDRSPFSVVGEPVMSVFAAAGASDDVARAAGGLHALGWRVDTLATPPALHFVVFPRHAAVVDEFARDLSAAMSGGAPAGPAGPAAYGVMVRGDGVDTAALAEHLDRRFDGAAGTESPTVEAAPR